MNTTSIGLDRIEEEILIYEVSDEALETAANAGNEANYTMFCSGISCPG